MHYMRIFDLTACFRKCISIMSLLQETGYSNNFPKRDKNDSDKEFVVIHLWAHLWTLTALLKGISLRKSKKKKTVKNTLTK